MSATNDLKTMRIQEQFDLETIRILRKRNEALAMENQALRKERDELANRIGQLSYRNTLQETQLGYLRDRVKNTP